NYARGHIQFELNRFEAAAASYAVVIAADPQHPSAHYNLGVCLEKLWQWAAAEDAFRKALQINPRQGQARVGLGACLLHQDRPAEALAVFDQPPPRDADAELELFGRAVALQVLSRYTEAEKAYEELLGINPESEEALANLIAMGIARRDARAVNEHSRRLLQVCPQSRQALQGLATLDRWSGRGDAKSTPPPQERRAPRLAEA
ncbi:MAG: tetratricopeptide repeat protein, partial [Bryobacteraceae bacterium]